MTNSPPRVLQEDFSAVLLGSFNPAIFHPEWFVRLGLLSESSADESKISVVSNEVTQFIISGCKFLCDHERLLISSKNYALTGVIQDLVFGIIENLPHIPIKSAGINDDSVFKVASEEIWHKIGHSLVPKEEIWNKLCEKPGMTNVSINSPVEWKHPVVENLRIYPILVRSEFHPAISVKANIHFDASSIKTDQESNELIKEFLIDKWKLGTSRSKEVAKLIIETYSNE